MKTAIKFTILAASIGAFSFQAHAQPVAPQQLSFGSTSLINVDENGDTFTNVMKGVSTVTTSKQTVTSEPTVVTLPKPDYHVIIQPTVSAIGHDQTWTSVATTTTPNTTSTYTDQAVYSVITGNSTIYTEGQSIEIKGTLYNNSNTDVKVVYQLTADGNYMSHKSAASGLSTFPASDILGFSLLASGVKTDLLSNIAPAAPVFSGSNGIGTYTQTSVSDFFNLAHGASQVFDFYIETQGKMSISDLNLSFFGPSYGLTTTPGTPETKIISTFSTQTDIPVLSPVPEPESYAMLLAGLGLMGFMVRRKKNAA